MAGTFGRSARLRVLTTTGDEPQQDCGTCRNQPNCWASSIKEEHVITNLLVCRIKRGIDVNRTTRLLLQMLRPKLKLFARHAIQGTRIDLETALADMESFTIEQIQQHYIMGEIAYPLHWLFDFARGHVYFYAHNYAKKGRKYEETHSFQSNWATEHSETIDDAPLPLAEDEETTQSTRDARAIVDDGLTLTLPEYRVLKFCLTNALDAKRPLNGLHIHLARSMGLVRARVTKIYSDAHKKLLLEAQGSR
jgi:hypothetical protein